MTVKREELVNRAAVLTRFTGVQYIIDHQMEGYRLETTGMQPVSPRCKSMKPMLEWIEAAIVGAQRMYYTKCQTLRNQVFTGKSATVR